MDFRQHLPLGQTGLMVSRLGIASGYGVPAASIEKAFHEHNLDYFWLSFPKRSQIRIALSSLLPRYRDKTVIVVPYFPVDKGFFLRRSVEAWLRQLNLDTVDVVLLQNVSKPSQRVPYSAASPAASSTCPSTCSKCATTWCSGARKRTSSPTCPRTTAEAPLTAADCYRFVLSNPNVNVCITGPSSAHQMEENLAALVAPGGPGPLRHTALLGVGC